MAREIIQTDKAPKAIGTYSQAVKIGTTVYMSGQIPLVPETMEMVKGEMEIQIRQVFDNLKAVIARIQRIAKDRDCERTDMKIVWT